jgi:hydroxylaminobenzene mutase
LNALLGAFWIFAVGWTLPMLRYGPTGQRRLAYGVILPNYANWLVTCVKAALHVAGIDVSADPANNAIFGMLTGLVVLPSVAAAVAWLWGLRPVPGTPSLK